jgi:hypothetical protein
MFFFYKNLFARDLNTYTSVPGSTKIVAVQPIHMQNTRCARGHVATSSGDGRWCSEKTLQQKGRRSEENVFGTFMYIFFILAMQIRIICLNKSPSRYKKHRHWLHKQSFIEMHDHSLLSSL